MLGRSTADTLSIRDSSCLVTTKVLLPSSPLAPSPLLCLLGCDELLSVRWESLFSFLFVFEFFPLRLLFLLLLLDVKIEDEARCNDKECQGEYRIQSRDISEDNPSCLLSVILLCSLLCCRSISIHEIPDSWSL